MTRTLDEAIFRAEQLRLDLEQLEKLLHDLDTQRQDPNANPPPRPRAPAVEPRQPGQPAPTTYGAKMDQAATVDHKKLIRAKAKGFAMTEEQLDAIVQRKFGKSHWNMITQREYMVLLHAIEAGER
jgi:hypothetical protein